MLFQKGGCVYILTTRHRTALYIGVTSDLLHRVIDHRNKKYPNSFTARYDCTKLVWYETFEQIEQAIAYEKKLKERSRAKKMELINALNPEWVDLWERDVQFW